ncbi:hypothetical protein BJ944DRAFT_245662 [Cunninghamella echinulata]|nr:hypothetical protein BJ944DRAFT_245662 [Cunninghamella echinulata]
MNALDQGNSNPNAAIEQSKTLTFSDDINNGKPVLSSNNNDTLGTKQKLNPVEACMDIDEKPNNSNNLPTIIKECSNAVESSRNIDFAPPRAYLDEAVVPTLLEGMKLLVSERPSNPLAFLGQFLIDRSNSSGSSVE